MYVCMYVCMYVWRWILGRTNHYRDTETIIIVFFYLQNIEAEDDFTFNAEFNSKFKRIKVPLVSAKEVAMEGSEGAAGE
jgi:hypothetical protein